MTDENSSQEQIRISVEKSLRVYLDENNTNTIYWIRQTIKRSGIDRKILIKVFKELKDFGDRRKYNLLYHLCLSSNFDSSKI